MTTGTFTSIREYISTSYRPDCDYVDGIVEERNLGEQDHSFLQAAVGSHFFTRRKEWGIEAFIERRIQVSPTRFRVPDVCVVLCERPAEPFRVQELRAENPELVLRPRDFLRLANDRSVTVAAQNPIQSHDRKGAVKEMDHAVMDLVVALAEIFE